MTRRYARTNAEAHLYMDLRPCSCGETAFDRRSAVITHDGVLCSRYTGTCPGCGTAREFVFELPETIRPIRSDHVEFGGADPSRLLDPGEWMAVATERAKRDPGTRDDLDVARAALVEVMKFLPPASGRPASEVRNDRVPDDAFVTERGRAVRDAEPGRFRRVRLEAVLDAWNDVMARYDAGAGAQPVRVAPPVPAPRAAPPSPEALAEAREVARLAEQPVARLIDALAQAAAAQHGFTGDEAQAQAGELIRQLTALVHRHQVAASEQRLRTKTSADVERLLDAIAKTDTEAGRALAGHRADVAELFRAIDLAQISTSIQQLVDWLRDPSQQSKLSMQQLLGQLQTKLVAAAPGKPPGKPDDDTNN